jgi:hypothetical protein
LLYRYYTIVVELMGTLVFGLLVGTVANLMQKKNMLEIKHQVNPTRKHLRDTSKNRSDSLKIDCLHSHQTTGCAA